MNAAAAAAPGPASRGAALARRIRDGDRAALEEAYRAHARRVRRAFGWRYRREPEEVDDAIALAFALLPGTIERAKLDEGFDLARHVFLAARQRYWNDYRSRARERAELFATPAAAERALARLHDDHPSPEDEAELASRVRLLSSLVEDLSPRLRDFLLGREVEGLGDRDLAARFGVRPAYARNAVGRARAALLELARGTPLEPWLQPREQTGANAGKPLASEAVLARLSDGEWHSRAELAALVGDLKQALKRLRKAGRTVEARQRPGARVGVDAGEWFEYRLQCAP